MPCFLRPAARCLSLLAVASSTFGLLAQTVVVPRVQAVRFWSFGDVTRIAIQTSGGYRLTHEQSDKPARAFFDLAGLLPPSNAHRGVEIIPVNDHRLKQIRIAPLNGYTTRIVFELESASDIISSQLVNPDRLMVEIRPHAQLLVPLQFARSTTGSRKFDESRVSAGSGWRGLAPKPALEAQVEKPQVTEDLPARAGVLAPGPFFPPEANATQTGRSSVSLTSAGPTALQQNAMNTMPPSVLKTLPPAMKYEGVAEPAQRSSGGDTSLVRVFGLKLARIVIDAGHGGHDTGTIGSGGLLEKDLVLDVALRLGALITKQLGAQVIYTRSDDVFIPLEQRTRIANDQKADLFISIHANSSPEPSATGVETYYFNFASDKAGLALATRENAMATSSISDLNDLLHRAVLQAKLEESRDFAQSVQGSLFPMAITMNSQSKNRGVRQAPFMVLIGATMPSILAEVGFVSNTHDEKLMSRSDGRQRIADALYKGVSAYANSLSHMQMARNAGR